MESINNEISDKIFELFKHNKIHRIKIEIEFINGNIYSKEEIKPNKLIKENKKDEN